MAYRFPIDVNLVGYWGLDESQASDLAIDESQYTRNLTVTAAIGVKPGRVGNARDFDGLASFASITHTDFQIRDDLTLTAWAKLDSYNSGGTQLRTIISCGSAGGNLLYSVGVDINGRIVYKHRNSTGMVIARTTQSVIRTNQLYNIAVRRFLSGPSNFVDVQLFVDNKLVAWADVTENAVPVSFPRERPLANALASLNLGRSLEEANSAFWDGLLDDVSVHNVARPYQAYLRAYYFGVSLANPTNRLTSINTIKWTSSRTMGVGVRWWCYQRDADLYVVKESPFGVFGLETRLTTTGSLTGSMVEKPELIYDPASDTLLVLFASGNRIYKLTAGSTDDPATVNMPYTADTGGIIKSVDNADGGSLGLGGATKEFWPPDITFVNRTPVKLSADEGTIEVGLGGGQEFVYTPGTPNAVQIALVSVPGSGFGVVVGPVDTENGGYIIYRVDGNTYTPLAAPTLIDKSSIWYTPVATRVYGRGYAAQALTVKGLPSGVWSSVIVDRFNEIVDADGSKYYGRDGDGSDWVNTGLGGGLYEVWPPDITYVNRTPIKVTVEDPDVNMLGLGGGNLGSITRSTTTIVLS